MGKRRQKNWKRKGVSGVVAMVIMIVLTITVIGIVWVVVNNLVREKIETTESCFGIFDKINVDRGYTCYNSSSKELQFSIGVGDIEVDEIRVAVSGEGTTSSFKMADGLVVDNLRNYPGGSTTIIFPGKNSGRTYLFNMSGAGFLGIPDSLEIAPIIGEEQCGVSDSVSEFDDCLLFS